MIDHAKRLIEVFATELNRVKLGDTVSFALNGPGVVIGPQGPAIGWTALVTLKHNKLVGQDDIGLSMPIFGVLPPDDVFRQAANFLVEKLREERSNMNNPRPEELADAMAATGPENQLPPGLRGLKLGGAVGG